MRYRSVMVHLCSDDPEGRMKFRARAAALGCCAAAVLSGAAGPTFGATARSYPEKPVRVFVGLAPGGGTDSVARLITQKFSDVLGQSFVVDNRPSAGGNVAGEL